MEDITTQTAAFGDTDNTLLLKIATATQAPPAGGALTDTQLRATPVPVSLGTDTDVIGKVGIDQTTYQTTNGVALVGYDPGSEVVSTTASGTSRNVAGLANVIVQVTAYSGNGVFLLKGSNDDTTYTTLYYIRMLDLLRAQNIAATGVFAVNVSGFKYLKLVNSSNTTGSITYTMIGAPAGTPPTAVVFSTNSVLSNSDTLGSASTTDTSGTASAPIVTIGATNGTFTERLRSNTATVLLASGARTTTQTSSDITTYNAQKLKVQLVTTVIGTGSITLSVEGKDANGNYYAILTGTAVVTDTTNIYEVGIGVTTTANVAINAILPRTIRIVITANNANSATYSAAYNLNP